MKWATAAFCNRLLPLDDLYVTCLRGVPLSPVFTGSKLVCI